MQNYPDQVTEAIRNYADRLVSNPDSNIWLRLGVGE
jgi:hypothetical protein